MREITITSMEEGQRFDRFLNKYMPKASSGFLHKMLRKKNIKLNEKKAEGNEKLKKGDKVQIYFSEETLAGFMDEKASRSAVKEQKPALSGEEKELRKQVKVLFRSEDIIILHKPVGMLTQKAKPEDDSLNDYLIEYCLNNGWITKETLRAFRPAAANRLDRNTSGMVLCGLTTKGLQTLSSLLRDRELKKFYLCIVKGQMSGSQAIRGYLTKNEENNVVTITKEEREGATYIATDYNVLASTKSASLLLIRLITGKSHQIRAHLASIGHPVAGDYKYGERKWNDALKREFGISTQMLHSYALHFPENESTTRVGLANKKLRDPAPKTFQMVQKGLGLEVVRKGPQ